MVCCRPYSKVTRVFMLTSVAILPYEFIPAFFFRFNQLTQGIYITLPYTLAVYMVRHFEGENGNEESIGRNTGLLVSSLATFIKLLLLPCGFCALNPPCKQLSYFDKTRPAAMWFLRTEPLQRIMGICTRCLQAAAASAAQAMTSYLWGTVSDHTGRKVCLCRKVSVQAAMSA